jgi:hypothetical protein
LLLDVSIYFPLELIWKDAEIHSLLMVVVGPCLGPYVIFLMNEGKNMEAFYGNNILSL